MKTEVLKSIKETEKEYRLMISAAKEDKKRSLADGKLEAENLIAKAQRDAEEYKVKCIADARKEAEEKYAAIISDGDIGVAALRDKSHLKLDNAVDLLVTEFKGKLNA